MCHTSACRRRTAIPVESFFCRLAVLTVQTCPLHLNFLLHDHMTLSDTQRAVGTEEADVA